MLSSSFQQIEAISISSFSCLFSFDLIVGLRKRIPCKIEGRIAASLYMFWMIILRFSIFQMIILIDSMIVIVIIEWMYLVSLPSSRDPDLIIELQVFTLLMGGIGLLGVTFKTTVPDNFIYHPLLKLYYSHNQY